MRDEKMLCPKCGIFDVSRDLSPRELEVAILVAKGLSNRNIGNRLFISERTVKNHVSNMFFKLGTNRLGILKYILEKGYIIIEDINSLGCEDKDGK